MTSSDTSSPGRTARTTFRTTLVRVVVVQVIALALLGLLQFTYNV